MEWTHSECNFYILFALTLHDTEKGPSSIKIKFKLAAYDYRISSKQPLLIFFNIYHYFLVMVGTSSVLFHIHAFH